jgi:hypothetical protein
MSLRRFPGKDGGGSHATEVFRTKAMAFASLLPHFASHVAVFIGTISGRPRKDALLKPSGAMAGKKVRRMILQRNIG